jgi:hypothetical protein
VLTIDRNRRAPSVRNKRHEIAACGRASRSLLPPNERALMSVVR